MSDTPHAATTFLGGLEDERFASRAEVIPVPPNFEDLVQKRFRFSDEARLCWRVLKAAARHRVLLVFTLNVKGSGVRIDPAPPSKASAVFENPSDR